eukprot:3011328-Amphidinium_carterae.1
MGCWGGCSGYVGVFPASGVVEIRVFVHEQVPTCTCLRNDLPEVVELLLDNGAEPFQRDLRTGLVPLELAEVGIDRQSGPNWNCIDVLKSVME